MDDVVAMIAARLSEPIAASPVADSPTIDTSIIDSPRIGMASEVARSPTRSTILLVEDETFVRQAMAAALRLSGYTVLVAADGHQALAACHNCAPPDLLLSDLVMPGMSGAHLATLFEAMYPWSRVLLMSGYAEELAPRGVFPSCIAQLRKPFSISTLIKQVGEILAVDTLALKAAVSKL
jgi:two-component system, cell cycle sensor histidine kinase and response regulator CckA